MIASMRGGARRIAGCGAGRLFAPAGRDAARITRASRVP